MPPLTCADVDSPVAIRFGAAFVGEFLYPTLVDLRSRY